MMMSGEDFLKSHDFEQAVLGLRRYYIFQQGVPGLWANNLKSMVTDG